MGAAVRQIVPYQSDVLSRHRSERNRQLMCCWCRRRRHRLPKYMRPVFDNVPGDSHFYVVVAADDDDQVLGYFEPSAVY